MILYLIFGFIFCLTLSFGIVCFTKLIQVKNKLKDMTDVLGDISSGNVKQKLLAGGYELTAPLSYQINEIIYQYDEKLSKLVLADETNRQLMTSLSHDVRTPLTTLIGYLDAIHREVVSGEEREEYIEIARHKAHDLKDYIDVLFDWFKLNSSEFSLSIKQVELGELTRNLLKDWIPIFEEINLDYEIELLQQPMQTKVDIDAYTRIINNLVHNVISHSQATQIKIEMSKTESEIKISIEDNGIGIEQSDLLHIFERLYKCDKGRSNKGSGLGLSIVRQMVEKMNGRITAQSIPNQCTSFTVYFALTH